ncbi:MAG: sigma-70 family polymerase sigma factor, partial [Daejeonella sp.]|nr:sigma-70 family polymerase sigma factor [Daejeonella sp.]
ESIDYDEIEYQVKQVKEAIKKLPDGYRIVLSLYLLEGYDHEEISSVLKISENTSRTQFMRAKRKLLEIIRTEKVI